MTLPAGLLPEDCNIELFADPENFGKCYWLQNGEVKQFCELPTKQYNRILSECYKDETAKNALLKHGIDAKDLAEHYSFCNFGKLDSIPDLPQFGRVNKEFFDCGKHDSCPFNEKVCGKNGLTFRERQCLRLNSLGKDYRQIKSEMGFRSQTAVNSLMTRCRMKLGVRNKTELLLKSQQLGII